jgi:AcrR family transcriptional regulator
MKKLAHRIGISEPAIYRHFQSKIEILHSMLIQFKHRSESLLERAHSFEGSARTTLENIFLDHAGQFIQHPHMAAVVFSEEAFQDHSRLSQEVFTVMNNAHESLMVIIERGQRTGEIRDDVASEHLALMILGVLRLTVKRWRLSANSFDLAEEIRAVWKSLDAVLV